MYAEFEVHRTMICDRVRTGAFRRAIDSVVRPGDIVEDDQDVRVAVVPVPGLDDPRHDLADLGGGHLGRVVGRAEADRIQGSAQEVRPGSGASLLLASVVRQAVTWVDVAQITMQFLR
jgi:hypothetical protein